MLFDFLQNIDAGQTGHLEIESDQVHRNLFEHFDGLSTAVGSVNVVVGVENHFE